MNLGLLGLGLWRRFMGSSAPAHGDSILMEDSGYILMEDGSTILLE